MISGPSISGETVSGVPGAFVPAISHLVLTETINYLQKPINCVVAGQQKETVKKAMGLMGAISGPLKGIFRE